MKIKSISKFAKAHNLSRQTLEHRIKAGWKFGTLNGEKVMYSPKYVQKVVDAESSLNKRTTFFKTIEFSNSHYSSGIIEMPECATCGSVVESDICIRTILADGDSDEKLDN